LIISSLFIIVDLSCFSSLVQRFSVHIRCTMVVEILNVTLTSFHSIFLIRKVKNAFIVIVLFFMIGSYSVRIHILCDLKIISSLSFFLVNSFWRLSFINSFT